MTIYLYLYDYYSENSIVNNYSWEPTLLQWWVCGWNPKFAGNVNKDRLVLVNRIYMSSRNDLYTAFKEEYNNKYGHDQRYNVQYGNNIICDDDTKSVWILWGGIIMVKIKKITCCLTCIGLLFLTGCHSKPSARNAKPSAREDAEKIFEILKDEDVSKLSDLFSDDVRANHNLEKELQDFFEIIDGNFTDYKKVDFNSESEGFDKDGKIDLRALSGSFENISTNTGNNYYTLIYYRTFVDSSRPDRVGLNGLRLIINKGDDESKIINVGLS